MYGCLGIAIGEFERSACHGCWQQLRGIKREEPDSRAALRNHIGSDIDFGEVGMMSDADISKNQIAYTKAGWINVRSSGSFTLKLTSQNDYLLTFPGGDIGKTSQTLKYTARLAGKAVTRNGSDTATISCVRAGLTTMQIPVSAELNEGGSLKAASSSYSDILSITLSPDVFNASGTTQCTN